MCKDDWPEMTAAQVVLEEHGGGGCITLTPEQERLSKCLVILKKGQRKGKICGKNSTCLDGFCGRHRKKK